MRSAYRLGISWIRYSMQTSSVAIRSPESTLLHLSAEDCSHGVARHSRAETVFANTHTKLEMMKAGRRVPIAVIIIGGPAYKSVTYEHSRSLPSSRSDERAEDSDRAATWCRADRKACVTLCRA